MAELKPYNPTIRDRIASALMGEARPGSARANMVEGLMGSRGIGTMGVGLADLTPIGAGLGAQEAAREGDYRGAAMNAMFLGPMARTANRTALTQAEKMAAGGASRDEIWNNTGWFQGPDSKWRFEIDDRASRMRPAFKTDAGGEAINMNDALRHKELFAAYPQLENMGAMHKPFPPHMEKVFGGIRHSDNTVVVNSNHPAFTNATDTRSTMLHELQHGVQRLEGFESGGNRSLTRDQYMRLAGEVEARNVQARMNMTPEQRRATPPWETQDVPFSEQILRAFGGK